MLCHGQAAVFIEFHGHEEHLSAEMMVGHPHMYLTEAESENVPVAVGITDKIAVAYALNDERGFVAVGQHGVVRIIFEGSPRRKRA